MSTDNPYQPNANPSAAGMDQPIPLPEGQQRGMVGQATVLGVLMIVQGVVNGIAGIIVAGYAIFMPQFMEQMRAEMAKQAAAGGGGGGGPAPPQLPDNFEMIFAVGGGILAVVLLLVAILMIYSGIGVMRFQRRSLAIGSLCFGMVTILTCYCFPTSLALAIYGLILLLNQPVVMAFKLRSEGFPVRRIQQAFMTLP